MRGTKNGSVTTHCWSGMVDNNMIKSGLFSVQQFATKPGHSTELAAMRLNFDRSNHHVFLMKNFTYNMFLKNM